MRHDKHGVYSVGLLSVSHFMSDFFNNFLPPLLPVVMANLGLSITAGGILVMISSLSSSILQPLLGYFVDRRGYAWLILLTIPASALFICLAGLAPSYALLAACIALSGLASSVFHPLASSLVSRVAAPENKGLAMSVFIGGGNFGFALAPAAIVYFLVNFGPAKLPWLVLPALALSLALYARGLHRVEVRSPHTAAAGGGGAVWRGSGPLLKLNAVMGLRSWSQVALPSFLPVWLAQQGQPPTLAGNLLMLFLLGGTFGGFIGGWAGDRFGRKACIVGSLAICLPALYFFLGSREITPAAWLLLALSGAALQATVPSSVIWAQNIIPDNAAMASGMMMGLAFGLGGLGTAITGAMADIIGLQTALLWSLVPLALAIPLAVTIPDTGRRPLSGAIKQ